MVDILLWNWAQDDMFSKSCALPRHSFEGGKRDSVVSVVEAAGGRLAEFFCEWSSPTGQSVQPGPRIHADGASSDTNCCDRKGASRKLHGTPPRHVTAPPTWSLSSHLFFCCLLLVLYPRVTLPPLWFLETQVTCGLWENVWRAVDIMILCWLTSIKPSM